ncbi:MAG: aspartyl protease family protein [Bryobacteraceae bacterium]
MPVLLQSGKSIVHLTATVDTGASFCIFRREVGTELGLDVESGVLKRFRTANSSFGAYEHEVELSVLGVVAHSTVYFFADEAMNKNGLGRTGWLDRVRLGLVDHDTALYLAPYDS